MHPESVFTQRLAGVEITHHERTPSSIDGSYGMRASFAHPDGQKVSVAIQDCCGDLGDNARLAQQIKALIMN